MAYKPLLVFILGKIETKALTSTAESCILYSKLPI